MSIKRKVVAGVAMLAVVAGAGTLSAGAATPTCGKPCISIFSRQLGTYERPNVVEAVLGGVAKVGQPVILKPADNSDPSQDLIGHLNTVSGFYEAGLVSAEAASRYGPLGAAQIEYAPLGMETDLCVGLADTPRQGQGLTLQPCTVPGRTVWIVDTPDSPATAPLFFPIVNAATTDFSRPFAMSYPSDQNANGRRLQQIEIRRLQFRSGDTVPDSQLWGAHFGVLP